MNFEELIIKNRSYRRFDQSVRITDDLLLKFVEYARFSPSGSNKQPLKFILSNQTEKNEQIFSTLAWAGYLKDWQGPIEGEQPAAYIIILRDGAVSNNAGVDHGIAAQSILLGAVAAGFGGCMLGAINRPKLAELLSIPERYEILLVVALGKPVETIILEDCAIGQDIKYYRDANQNHHVPKRTLDELILS
ncbi:MAG: nitroreductase family protein [Anaerolineae bacterium]|nr:nitroreductase family protein [Anaerolineae bacterium]